MSFLNPLYNAVAYLLIHIHDGLDHVIHGGWAWALSIVLLTIGMRLVLFPVFVKQIRSQRGMQMLQPKMKELQAKYKNDKERLNQEMMKLWKEAGVNPFTGCLPLLLQIPIFIALFHTLNKLKPTISSTGVASYKSFPNFSTQDVFNAAHAKIFGIPIAAAFNSSHDVLHALGASATSTKILCAILTVIMVATTFITQRQLMARNAANGTTQLGQQQKILLYVFPLFFLIYGYRFPIGVLLYWLTTNLWSMGQQLIVIRRMDMGAQPAAVSAAPAGPAPGARPDPQRKGKAPAKTNLTKPGPAPPTTASEPTKPDAGANGASSPKRPASDIVLPPGGAMLPTAPAARPGPSPARNKSAGRSKNRSKRRGRR